MKNNFKFEAKEVICNGNVGGCARILTEENMSTLRAFLKTHFMMAPQEVILKELEDSGVFDENWIIGSRAGDIDEIIYRMVSGLVEYGHTKFAEFTGTNELTEMWINAQVKMMTAKDIITIAESALIDCATADYWYAYEKQWD